MYCTFTYNSLFTTTTTKSPRMTYTRMARQGLIQLTVENLEGRFLNQKDLEGNFLTILSAL